MNKRKLPSEWATNGTGPLSPKQQKSTYNHLMDDSDMDALLSNIDFDECMDVEEAANGIDVDANGEQSSAACMADLSTWTRCRVETIERDPKTYELIIAGVEDTQNSVEPGKQFVCRLKDAWSSCRITANDVVSLKAIWNADKNCFTVTNASGFVVIKPDLLISGTTVVNGLFCIRKAVLSDRFSGIEANNKIMTVGSIIHELLQIVLQRKLTTLSDIKSVTEELLISQQMAFTLYACQMTAAEAFEEVLKFQEKIVDFVDKYLTGSKAVNGKKDGLFEGQIDNIQDIEENIWIPQMGLKGKVDASVNVRPRGKKGPLKYMPLELKTGRASFSSEHKGQLIIYQMMMSEVGAVVDSGLLLYLREGVMKEIEGTHNERRDLIFLRNEMAHYLQQPIETAELGESVGKLSLTSLPEPISHRNACASCAYNVLCSMCLKEDEAMWKSLSANHPMREMAPLVTGHLTEAHVAYFCHWVGLLSLEEREAQKSNLIRNLWLETPEQRQKHGRAVTNLQLDPNVVAESDSHHLNRFSRAADGCGELVDLTCVGINVGDYLIVSTTKRLNVAAGRVHSLQVDAIVIALERNLFVRYKNQSFILDKYESKTVATFNMANMGALLDDTEGSQRLRSIIIEKTAPTFTKQLPAIIATKGKELLKNLNSVQRNAAIKAITANDYLLLRGLPGTGKTQTLATIIRLLTMMGKSILITSHTHSAVDNLLMRVLRDDPTIQFLRLGAKGRIRPELWQFAESELTKDCRTPDDYQDVYNRYNIVGVTCLGAAHALLTRKHFDICVVDESTQVLQTTVIRPLLFAQKFILVGDPDQLPPIIRSPDARKLGADESLFARLDSPAATVVLTLQYRMNRTITKLANDLTYKGALKCGNDTIAQATYVGGTATTSNTKWLQRLLSTHIDQSVCLLNTGNVYRQCTEYMAALRSNDPLIEMSQYVCADGDTAMETTDVVEATRDASPQRARLYSNYCEAGILLMVIGALKAAGVRAANIGVIAPYVLQVELLKQIIHKCEGNEDVEVNTVDQYQGRDKEIIIYSCTKTGRPTANTNANSQSTSRVEILDDQRRLTVAITRAKHKLILIGDAQTLECHTPFRCLLKSMSGINKMNLVDGQHGFQWTNVMQCLNDVLSPEVNRK